MRLMQGVAVRFRFTLISHCPSLHMSAGGGRPGLQLRRARRKDHHASTDRAALLGCTKPQSVTFNVNGTLYGVNGAAIDHGNQPVDPIWKTASPGPRADLGPMIQKGLSLCNG